MNNTFRIHLSVHAATAKPEILPEGVKKRLSEKKEVTSYTAFFTELNKSGKTPLIEFFTGPVGSEISNAWKEELNISFGD